MKNLLRNLWLSPFAVLLVSTFACTKPSFAPIASAGGDAGGGGGAGGSGPAPDASVTCPEPNLPCSGMITTDICDPVCQTGGCNWCSQKCTYAFDNATAQAQPACAANGAKTFPQACAVVSLGSASQYDDCAPGSICLAPTIGDNFTYCFSLCRSKADCLYQVACGQRKLSAVGGLVSVCDPPYDQCGADGTCCDPFGGTAGTVCATNRVCLLVSPDPVSGHSRTVCEFGYGDGRNGTTCASSRDCRIKNTCVGNQCRQVCNNANPCPGGGNCTTPVGSEYGYCPN
jgi:hypothetical protein